MKKNTPFSLTLSLLGFKVTVTFDSVHSLFCVEMERDTKIKTEHYSYEEISKLVGINDFEPSIIQDKFNGNEKLFLVAIFCYQIMFQDIVKALNELKEFSLFSNLKIEDASIKHQYHYQLKPQAPNIIEKALGDFTKAILDVSSEACYIDHKGWHCYLQQYRELDTTPEKPRQSFSFFRFFRLAF